MTLDSLNGYGTFCVVVDREYSPEHYSAETLCGRLRRTWGTALGTFTWGWKSFSEMRWCLRTAIDRSTAGSGVSESCPNEVDGLPLVERWHRTEQYPTGIQKSFCVVSNQ